MKRLVVVFGATMVAIVAMLCMPGQAAAHVLLVDRQANIAAVLHMNPADDPIAGQPSQLFFDVQDAEAKYRIPYSAYQLSVTDELENTSEVSTSTFGTVVSAGYTFPRQGLYRLTLRTSPSDTSQPKIELQTSIRVTRGEGAVVGADRYPWAQAGLQVAAVLLVLLLIRAYNNKAEIIADSRL